MDEGQHCYPFLRAGYGMPSQQAGCPAGNQQHCRLLRPRYFPQLTYATPRPNLLLLRLYTTCSMSDLLPASYLTKNELYSTHANF